MGNIIEEYKKYSTPSISDAMDKLGIEGTCLGISPLNVGFSVTGRAFTVKYGPIGTEKGTVGDYIDDIQPGDVVVLDNGARVDCTVWGDILTTVGHRRGVAGTVINGVCRDVSKSLQLDYPIFSRGKYMRTGKDRVQVEGVNVAVSMGEVRVAPGDLVVGDADGVVIVPKEREEEVLKVAMDIERKENMIRDEVLKGVRLDEARKSFGYHHLQRQK